jgi:uncharacterized YceG family protein
VRSSEEREAARREREVRRGRAAGGVRRRFWGVAAALLVGVVAVAAAWFLLSLFQPFKGDGEGRVRVVVPEGASLGQIADLLERQGVVSSSSFFRLRARLAGRSDDLKPGPYRLRRDMSFVAALDVLERGPPPDVVLITIPEGRSREEIQPLVSGKLEGSYEAASRRSSALDPREFGAEGARSLEGFLFPATFELKRKQSVRRLIEQQLAAFRSRFETVDMRYARRRNLNPYDVLIIASMVEREAAVPRERRLVASVIYNRLRQGIPLGIDATIRYATGNWNRPLRVSELESPTPYNTRTNPGLPPGPIGNPGLASINAAANPVRTRYLFYVVKPGTCGEHAFAATDAEHQRNVARYEDARRRRGGRSPTDC